MRQHRREREREREREEREKERESLLKDTLLPPTPSRGGHRHTPTMQRAQSVAVCKEQTETQLPKKALSNYTKRGLYLHFTGKKRSLKNQERITAAE